MPTARIHTDQASRQRAYRERQAQARKAEQLAKGLPPLPLLPHLPGKARWAAMLAQARELLAAMQSEMQEYHDTRTEAWQEGEKGEAMQEKIVSLDDILATLDDLN